MSDTKTLSQKVFDAQMKANSATSNLEFEKGQLAIQAKDFAALMGNPDFQQTALALWREAYAALHKSGLSIEDFAKALFTPQAVVKGDAVTPEAMARAKAEADAARRLTLALYPNAEKTQNFEASLKEVRAMVIASEMRQHAAMAKAVADTGGGPPPAPCSCGPMEACSRCPEVQDPARSPHAPEIEAIAQVKAVKEALEHAKMQAEDTAKLSGVNSVARGDGERQQSWHSGRIESALDDLHRALLEKRTDPCPLHMVVEVDRSALDALANEHRTKWTYLPREFIVGDAFQVNLPNGTILVREKK